MTWNEADLVKYDVIGACYSSDRLEAEFATIKPLLPPPKWRRGKPTDPEAILNAKTYMIRCCCAWRYSPNLPLQSSAETDESPALCNFPLPRGADWLQWREALQRALTRIDEFCADALVISLGVDAYEGDPISFFKLASEDFLKIGEAIGWMRTPTLFLMEGGYAIAEIAVNAVNVLTGFENA